jgi:hypothetical protein
VPDEFPDEVACVCGQPQATHDCFDNKAVGVDPTEGRYAEVSLRRCRRCSRLWLRYFVEYESFSRSGRWARGLISERDAETITPEAAAPYLARLPWYLYGGSYFDGVPGRRSGGMIWGP